MALFLYVMIGFFAYINLGYYFLWFIEEYIEFLKNLGFAKALRGEPSERPRDSAVIALMAWPFIMVLFIIALFIATVIEIIDFLEVWWKKVFNNFTVPIIFEILLAPGRLLVWLTDHWKK